MKRIYDARKSRLFLILIVLVSPALAQPTVLQSSLFATGSNTTPASSNVRMALNTVGAFKQVRFLVNTVPGGTNTWAFHQGTTAAPDYTTCWRPYNPADAGGAISLNAFIQPNSNVNAARCNSGSGGTDGNLPTITAGRYYTFNVTNNAGACGACAAAPSSGGTCNSMSILETNYDPVTINTITASTPLNASNSVLVTATTSAAPSAGEYVYVRYSTDGYVTSTISQFTFTGTTGKALIPCFAGGTNVSYYVYSSNNTLANINTDVATYGQTAHDMYTLNLNNNGGSNYTYTQGSGTNMDGIFHVPSTCYATLSAFAIALNGGTITAPVTCYAVGGSPTETVTAGGINLTATGTLANPIVFQKFGSGSYTLQASAALTAGRLYDGIIKLIGSDYVTIDGFTLQENAANSTTTAGINNMTEWGIALLHASVTDGAQNNTIQNNTISLNRNYQNTFGIYSNGRHSTTAVTTVENVTNATGAHSGNKVYSNSISNVGYGIVFIGSSTAAFMDNGNDIGGASSATGNTLSNWGEGATAVSGFVDLTITSNFGIYAAQQINENISYNSITSATVSGGTFTFGGILKTYTSGQPTGTITSAINNNTITVSSSNASGNVNGILNSGMTALATATFTISNNLIANCVINGVGTFSAFGGIIHTSAPGTINITNNIMRGLSSTSVQGGFTGISNSGAVVNTINITNNKIGDAISGAATYSVAFTNQINCITNSNAAATATLNINNNSIDGLSIVTSGQQTFLLNTGGAGVAVNINNNSLGTTTGNLITMSGVQTNAVYPIYSQGTGTNCNVTIQGNDIRGIVHSVTGSCGYQFFTNTATAPGAVQTISNNTLTNITLNTTGQIVMFIRGGSMTATGSSVFSNNSIVTGFNRTGSTTNALICFYSTNSSVNGSTMSETGNNFSNITGVGNHSFYGFYNLEGVSTTSGPTKTCTGNTLSNINVYQMMGFYYDYGASTTCSSNVLSNFNGAGYIYGINIGNSNGQGTHNYSSNSMTSFTSTGANGYIAGIIGGSTSIPTTNIYGNTISGLSSAGASISVQGIELDFGQTVNIYDNNINNLTASGSTGPVVRGINCIGGTTNSFYRNKINSLSATGTTSSSPTDVVTGIVIGAGTTVNAYNNFVADLTAPSTSLADAIRGISIPTNIPGATNNLYYNSIYINAASSGTNFGTAGIYHYADPSATVSALNMIDNIIVNTSTASGTGVSAAYRRFGGTTLANYATTSDYNLFYAGTPSATKLIYYDGTNSDQTLAAFQTRVSPREANSISLMPNFTSATDLHLTATNNCSIDGAGIPIGGYIDDIDLQTRNAATPDIGADEFTATYSTTLAGVVGSATCANRTVAAAGTIYTTSGCNLIAKVLPSGGSPVAGQINTCVTLDDMTGALPTFNAEPYLTRHFDIEPTTANNTTTSATITLYFTQAEFDNYNAKNGVWPDLPTGPADAAGIANLKVTQYHGTPLTSPSQPGMYTYNGGNGVYIDPNDANIVWNGSYWAVTFDITGFSGFYVHTNFRFPLPITINYFHGTKQGSNHLLDWKVTCNSTPSVTMTLERSGSSTGPFTGINTTTADAVRCNQPFNYTDAQPLKGMNYYRLKMVDATGKVSYSNIVALLNAVKGTELVSIAPNPVTSDGAFKLNIASAQATKIDLVISDMMGRVVMREQRTLIAGFNSLDMNAVNLAPGTYTIRSVTADDRSGMIRFVKQ